MIKKITGFQIKLNKERVLFMIECIPDTSLYKEIAEEYEALEKEAYNKIDTKALLEFGVISESIATDKIPTGTKALFVITSIGNEMSKWSTNLFKSGNYVAGMLVNAMADDALFQMDDELRNIIVDICKKANMGIIRRVEAPSGIHMKAQKLAWEITKAKKNIGLDINSSYMYDPVKTTCQIYLLDENCKEYRIEHSCRECNNDSCKYRSFKSVVVTVKRDESEYKILCQDNESILDSLLRNDILISAICGGRGSCGKCKIKLLQGNIAISKEDKIMFTKKELEEGLRLSCRAYPHTDCTILLDLNLEDDFSIISTYRKDTDTESTKYSQRKSKLTKIVHSNILDREKNYGIGIDIGTTTIVMQLVECESGKVLDTYTAINKQRRFGADVISRIDSSNAGNKEKLKQSICSDLKHGIMKLIVQNDSVNGENKSKVRKIVIAGNTTMIHLLMGYSCKSLGVYPFTPVNIKTIHTSFKELFHDNTYDISITIMPGISTFVGGDITAGLLECEFDKNENISVFIDLGTNGEIAIGNREKIIVTSTAAGPAFEGGNITFGTGSIPGAICHVDIKNNYVSFETIGNKAPVGICGTGVIEAASEMIREHLIDTTGLFDSRYFEIGYPLAQNKSGNNLLITQKDIREIQLAKSAIRAGIETLLQRYKTNYEQIHTVYLAGGFGYKVNIQKAMGIGLLPKEFKNKVKVIGNSSLSGTISYLCKNDTAARIEHIISKAYEINLSIDKDFNSLYVEHIDFE